VGRAPSVYPVREDTWLLLPFARAPGSGRLVEIGCGRGVAAIEAARSGWTVVATDRNPEALAQLRVRALAERLRLDPVRTDLAEGLAGFDRVLANPPYLPTRPGERDPDRWVDLALNGGPDGLGPTDWIVRSLPRLLRPEGRAYLVVSSRQARERWRRILDRWAALGGRHRVVARRALEGETLEVVELEAPESGRSTATWSVRPRRRRPRGTGGRRRARSGSRTGSSPAPARGRTTALGGASGRRRSRRRS
jgi:release factor glutamine methyltransferase